ncbi:MAG: sodium:proton antiporter [Spirochaetes bacterium]|nr:sodium:proton antiporter [Spirochaetota bacterium]
MEQEVFLAATGWTLLPIFITIASVFLTRRILLSMFIGIVASALMVANGNLFDAVLTIERTFVSIFFVRGELQLFGVFSRWYLSIIIFLLGLGVVTSFVVITGGARAFVDSIAKRVKTRRGVQLITVAVGIILMIDDYFNAMVNGNIGKTLAQKHNLSRARVAYNVDSIAAPICIVAPISSWAVAIMGNITTVYEQIGFEGNVFIDFLSMIPYHFYVFAAIGLVLITIKFDFNMFTMKKYEKAMATGKDLSADDDSAGLMGDVQSSKGSVLGFCFPIAAVVIVTIGTMALTGVQRASAEAIQEHGLVYAALRNWSLSMSLLLGGLAGIVSSMYLGARHVKMGEITKEQYWRAVVAGLRSMSGAIAILTLSWIISSLIGTLQTGQFFANMLQGAGIAPYFVPFIMFVTAAILAFSIGTSWGTFAIVLPIAGAAAYAIDINMLFPAMSAVLSGAVFGDHASPISDTTVLASAGSSCKVLSHFESQLPYAVLAAGMASVGYLAFGFGRGNLLVGFIGFAIAIGAVYFAVSAKVKKEASANGA